jgi:hypothetical protein
LIIGAVIAKLLLIDQVLERLLVEGINIVQRSFAWLFSSVYNTTRFLSFTLATISLLVHYLNIIDIPFIDAIASLLFALPIALTMYFDRENEPRLFWRIPGGIIGFIAILIVIGERDQISLYYLIPSVLLLLWSINLPKLYRWSRSFIRELYNILRSLINGIAAIFTSIYNAIRTHPMTSLRITLLILTIPAYFFAPQGSLLSIGWNLLLPGLLVFLAALPSLIAFSQSFFPQLYHALVGFVRWLAEIVTNYDLMLTIGGLAGLISLFFIQDESIYLQIGVASLSTIMLSFAGQSFLMRFYDVILYGFARLISGLIRLIRMIIPKLELGFIVSFLAWVMLFAGLFAPTLWSLSPVNLRWYLIIGSIFVWNSAYESRRKRFYGFLNSIFGGIWKRIRHLIMWTAHNIFIVLLWLVGIGFFVLSIGLFFSTGYASDIFVNVMDNSLVRIIIALSLAGIGLLTLQQSVARREQLRMSSGGRK